MTDNPSISLAEYARRRNLSRQAVSEAVKQGRLSESVDRSGRHPRIADPELADQEWQATTDFSKAPNSVKVRASQERGTSDPAEYDLANEAAREKHWKANLAELEYQTRAGKLVPVEDVESALDDAIAAARTKLLGIRRRIQQRLPHLDQADVDLIHELIREALEDLARDGESAAEA